MKLKPWMFVAAIWLWPATFNVVTQIVGWRAFGWDAPKPSDLVFTFGDWFGYALFTPAIFWAAARWPVVRPFLVRRSLIQLGFALLFSVVWAIGGKIFTAGLAWVFDRDAFVRVVAQFDVRVASDLARNVGSWILTTIPFGVVVYTTVSGLAHAITYFDEARTRDVQLARVSEQLTAARFAALQAQLNPHFLFNTLNTLTVLVRDGDKGGAVQIIEHLSELLRRTLGRHRDSEVRLVEEFGLVSQYVAIEEMRFPDRLRVTIDLPESLRNAAVPGFAIQHLVENAIRHGIARREEAGIVSARARREGDDLVLTVIDDGPGITSGDFPAGHGLANTRDRLRALHGARATLEVIATAPVGTKATLRVPYRELAEGETSGH